MLQGNAKIIAAGVGALVLVGTLAACASGGGSDEPTATKTVTRTASPSTSPSSSSPSDSASASSGTGGSSGGSSGGGTSTGGSGSGSASGTRCAAANLTGSLQPGGGGAAGSVEVNLALKNTGTASCTLQGWPGVSFVGGGNGTQIGAPATLDQAAGVQHPTVTLAAGQSAVAPLKIVNWQNYSNGECAPRKVDGFRVYPPGSKQSVFISSPGTGCSDSSVKLLSVQAFTPAA
jgi:hypothetical protein